MEVMEFLKIYQESWNKLDAELIIPHLAEKFEYSSMWVFQTLDHNGFVDYIRGKFEAIRNSDSDAKPIAKIVKSPSTGEPCLQLKQGEDMAFLYVTMSDDGKVKSIGMLGF